eukprot:1158995-Pelagomonas_calceolata.AAC.7
MPSPLTPGNKRLRHDQELIRSRSDTYSGAPLPQSRPTFYWVEFGGLHNWHWGHVLRGIYRIAY